MYGLVNKLVVATIERHYGADRWREASRALPFDSHRYVAMQPYDDDETYAIVATACGHLSVAAADLMRLIGRDWVAHTSRHEYRELFAFNGPDLYTFIGNLNNLHATLGNQMPGLRPPSFTVRREPVGHIVVGYYSHRAGLAPLVIGLLEGLCEHFGVRATVRHARLRVDEGDHDEFCIELEP